MHGRQSSLPMLFNLVPRQKVFELLVTHEGNLVDFVRCPKAIHEMQKGHTRVERGHLRNDRHIVGFLDGKGGNHGQSTASNEHGVAMVSIDRQAFTGQGSRCHMNDSGQQFTRNLVHVGNVEQEALRSCKGCGDRPRNQRSMECSSCTRQCKKRWSRSVCTRTVAEANSSNNK